MVIMRRNKVMAFGAENVSSIFAETKIGPEKIKFNTFIK